MPSSEDRRELGTVGTAAGLGCSIVVSVIFCIGGGFALDERFGSSPVLTLIGVVLALILSGYQLFELAYVGRKDHEPGPVTKQIQRISSKRER